MSCFADSVAFVKGERFFRIDFPFGMIWWALWTTRACTGPCRTPIPAHAEHRFRGKPNTHSDASRTPIPGRSNTLSGRR